MTTERDKKHLQLDDPSLAESIIIISACTLAAIITGGTRYSVGILLVEWMDYFQIGSAMAAWLGSVTFLTYYTFGPFANVIVRWFRLRPVLFTAAMVFSTALALSSLAANEYILMVGWAIAGVGLCFFCVPLIPYIIQKFPVKIRSVANGLFASGTSCGTFLYTFIVNGTLEAYGWRGCMLILAGISLNLCAVALCLLPIRHRESSEERVTMNGRDEDGDDGDDDDDDENITKDKSDIVNDTTFEKMELADDTKRRCVIHNSRDLFHFYLFKNWKFLSVLLHFGLLYMSAAIVYIHIVSGTLQLYGVDLQTASYTISCVGLSNLVGRFAISVLVHLPRVDTLTVHNCCNIILGILLIIFPHCGNYVGALIVSALIGLALSGYGSLPQIVLVDQLGDENLQTTFAYLMVVSGAFYSAGGPLAGVLYDLSGDYQNSFYFAAAIAFLSVIVLLPAWIKQIRSLQKV
ncbi:monocarboxylate transporter 14-like [Tubulanus polymorphus]|uniref:monocarboxylate transporter 14-like n=1 Tax=Tubulanus polymorphus TaxID=672921 RepID=UPI003DA30287